MKRIVIEETTRLLTTYRGDGTYILRTFPDLFRDGFEHVAIYADPQTHAQIASRHFASFTPSSALKSIEDAHEVFVLSFDTSMLDEQREIEAAFDLQIAKEHQG